VSLKFSVGLKLGVNKQKWLAIFKLSSKTLFLSNLRMSSPRLVCRLKT